MIQTMYITRIFKKAAILALLLVTFMYSQAKALPLTVVHFDPGTTYYTPMILDDTTWGSEMYGMNVTAYFHDGSSETRQWSKTEDYSGGVTGQKWAISLNGTSMTNPWKVTWDGAEMVGLMFDAKTGRAAFDIKWPTLTSTPATYSGVTFKVTNNPENLDFIATYSNLVGVNPQLPAGDLYRNLYITWSGSTLYTSGSFDFLADTDTIKKPIPGQQPIPEPATLLLFGTGLTMLTSCRLRKKRKGRI